MHQHLARIISVAVVLLLIGCSSGGGPTAPPVDTQNQPGGLAPAGSAVGLTPNIITSEPEERILGNFYYYSNNGETLAWGTVLINQDGWNYRIDYLAPKLRALRQSEVTREAQAVVDLTWLKLINVGVSYTNKPLPIPPDLATYEPGELMDYRVDIQNKIKFKIKDQTVIATQVDMFNNKLGDAAQNIWTNVTIPVSGLSLFDNWIVEPTLANGIYYTRVRVGFQFWGGWITVVIFDAKAGAFKVEKGVGPEYFDPVAKGVTTTPVVAVGENVHVQDNGSYDPDGGTITLYEWDFDNDGTFDATGPSADTIYYTPGVYYINLRVTDDEGAKDDLTDDPGDQLIEVTVTPPPVPPVAIASASKYEAYVAENITFTGTDSYDPDGGDIVLHEWDWDNDGTYDSLGGVVDHSYSTPGTYYVQLRVTDDEVQTDTLDEPLEILIKPAPIPPNACFTYDPESPVPCELVTFDASCSSDEDGEIVKYSWDFDGDGEVDLETEDPIVEVPAGVPGDYNVILTVTDDSGLEDQAQDTVTVVNALPTAVLTVDKTEAYVGEDIAFDACDSHDNDCAGEEIIGWEFYWDKDGEPVGSPNCTATHAYDTPGVYKVDVRVTDDEGGTDRLDEGTWPEITILAQHEAPIAIADADPKTQTVCEPVHFFDDGSYDPDGGLIVSYEWDWNGDGVYENVGDDIYHSFTTPGDWFVQFRVTDDEGQTDTLDEPIHIIVQNALPTAVAIADKYTAAPDEVINFDGSDSHDNDCDMQEIVKWEWDWNNDGTFEGSGEIAEHSYTEPGTYYVQLRVMDNENGTDTLDQPLEIVVSLELFDPIAYAKAGTNSTTVCYSIYFQDDGSYDPDGGDIQLYEWDWNGDGTFDESGPALYHTFTEPGDYDVQFRVTDDEGATDTLDAPLAITIENALPTAVAYASSQNVYVNETVTFDGSDSYDNDCEGSEIVLWEWDWDNDGTYDASGAVVEHAFTEPGIYPVMLRVTDDEGGTDTLDEPLQITVSIEYFDPIAYAKADTNQTTVCYSIFFQDDGSYDPDGGDIQLYEWDWNNDGTFDESGKDVYHSFDTPGNYEVQFRVTDDEGATDTLDTLIQILVENALPTAVGSASKYEAYVGELIDFDGSGSYDNDCDGQYIAYWEWDWENDGVFEGSGEYASHSYSAPGIYPVQLRVTDNEGGTDTLDVPLSINVTEEKFDPIAFAAASPNPQIVCENVHLYDDGSYDPDGGSIQLFEWDINNDGTYEYTGSDIYYAWTVPGTYYVQMRVTDDEGATDTLDSPLEIMVENSLPTAVGSASKYEAYVGELIDFDGSDSYDNDCDGEYIAAWEWDWTNDGVFEGSGEYASHSYSAPGQYQVQLRVTDNEGGIDTLDVPLSINVTEEKFDPIAFAAASPNPQIVCENVHLYDDGSYDPDGGSIQLFEWDIDTDGTYEYTGSDIYFAWTVPGTYYVQMRVTDDEGETDTLDTPLEVMIENALPTAVAYASKTEVLVNELIDFDGSDSYDNDCDGQDIVAWEWDWTNDGVFEGSGEYASHSYSAPGTYYVQLRVTDDEGGTDTLDNPITIHVSVAYEDPIAFADASPNPQIVCEQVHLYDDGSYDPDGGSIQLFEWDIDNDGTYEYTGSDIYYAWTVPGTYYVQMRVTDDEGATDMLDTPLEIMIENALPTAVASASKYEAYIGESIDFDGSGSYDNDCDGQSIVTWEWDWTNDGIFEGSGEYPSHTYFLPGVYQVQLRVTDNEGGTDLLDATLSISITEHKFDPIAFADADPNPQTVCEQVHLYDDGSYDPDGGLIAGWEWDIDNDGTYEYTGSEIFNAWDVPGTYYVQMRVTDDEGATDTLDSPLEIHITNALPSAYATVDKTMAEIGELFYFDGSGSHDNDCDGEAITAWEWDFDYDGTFNLDDHGKTVSHAYDTPGIYQIMLRVTDNEGATNLLGNPLVVTVTVPSCPVGIHYFDILDPASRRGLSHGYSSFAFSVLPRADIAFIEAGSMAGLGIVQGGQNSLVTFDPDVDADDPINDGIFVKPTGGAKGTVLVTNLDGAPYDSMVSVVTSDKPNELRLLDTSVIAGMFFPYSHSFGAGYKIMAVDFSESGDIWAVVQRPAASGIDLMYSAYVGDPVFYETWHATSIGSIIGTETDVFDIAVNWAAGKLYIFDAGTEQRGRVTVFDISNPLSPSVSMTADGIFDQVIYYSCNEEFGVAGFADIDIDHVGSDETCHILVYARVAGTYALLQKFDQYMSPLGLSVYNGDVWPTFTINPETMPEDRDLVLPGTSKLGFWFAPLDW